MPRHRLGLTAAALLLLNITTGVGNAAASETGYYIGASAGSSSLSTGNTTQNLADDLVASGYSTAAVGLDQKSTGFKILGGYQINPNFAAEVFYADLGTYNFSVATTGPTRSGNGDYKATAYGLDLLGVVPVKPSFSLLGRFGIYRRDAKGSFNVSGGSSGSVPEITTNAKFGVGLEWEAAPAIGLRLDWEYYNDKDAPVSMLSAGIVSHF